MFLLSVWFFFSKVILAVIAPFHKGSARSAAWGVCLPQSGALHTGSIADRACDYHWHVDTDYPLYYSTGTGIT